MQVRNDVPNVLDAILDRKSVRSFRSDPVDANLIRRVLEVARHSPSWSNTQPWEVSVVSGKRLASLKTSLAAKLEAGEPPNPDIPWPHYPDVVHERSRENGLRLFGALGIERDDRVKRHDYTLSMQRFCDAPTLLIFSLEKSLPVWSMLDMGLFLQTMMLSAHGHGLNTCTMAVGGRYPDAVRAELGIPDSKQIVCAMAVGYADDVPVNQFRSNRLAVEQFVRWCGDD